MVPNTATGIAVCPASCPSVTLHSSSKQFCRAVARGGSCPVSSAWLFLASASMLRSKKMQGAHSAAFWKRALRMPSVRTSVSEITSKQSSSTSCTPAAFATHRATVFFPHPRAPLSNTLRCSPNRLALLCSVAVSSDERVAYALVGATRGATRSRSSGDVSSVGKLGVSDEMPSHRSQSATRHCSTPVCTILVTLGSTMHPSSPI